MGLDDCYIKDDETGEFRGSKARCPKGRFEATTQRLSPRGDCCVFAEMTNKRS
ncbi:hypothetical protein MCHI_001160 [Candidatus Magnetoovum chiemensis]|nr:hypothetical protein MCHI_001160 [Candidatus Magnetoovum chiemensis]